MAIFQSLCRLAGRFNSWLGRIPYTLIALLGRFAIAGVFWRSGQTKVEGLRLDLLSGDFKLGWPHLSESAVALFRNEYRLPLISPELGAYMAAVAEHLFPVMLLLGLGTRFASLALLLMTAVIEIFVYPDAWPTHGTWAAILLMLMAMGPGRISLDCLLARHFGGR